MNNHSMAQEGGLNQPSHVTGSLPKPYYEDSKRGIVIYHADCREVLPHLPKVDLLLTDPPYGIGYVHRGNNKKRKYQSIHAGVPIYGDDKEFDPTHWLAFDNVCLWGAEHFKEKLPNGGTWVTWDKRCGVTTERDQSDAEHAWLSCNGVCRVFRHVWDGFVRDSESNTSRQHPTQKPVALMKWCLGFFSKSETVLDPFMGSGTTLVACKELGKKCIGIELEERYCEIAARRLSQDNLFEPEELSQLAGGGK